MYKKEFIKKVYEIFGVEKVNLNASEWFFEGGKGEYSDLAFMLIKNDGFIFTDTPNEEIREITKKFGPCMIKVKAIRNKNSGGYKILIKKA